MPLLRSSLIALAAAAVVLGILRRVPPGAKAPTPEPAQPPPGGVTAGAEEDSNGPAPAGELAALLREIRDRLPSWAAPPRQPRLPRRIHRLVREAEPWGVLLAAVGLFLALIAFWVDYRDRVEERTVRAWQLLTTRAPGNSGKKEALEYLNREDGPLCFEVLHGLFAWQHGDHPARLAGAQVSGGRSRPPACSSSRSVRR